MKTIRNYLMTAFFIISLLSACNPAEQEPKDDHKEEEHQTDMVSLTMQQMKAINLKLGEIEQRNLNTNVKTNGRIELPPQSKANVSALIGGAVKDVFVIEGDFVKKGMVLATLEHPDIVEMQQQYLETVNNLEFLEQDYFRKKKLYEEEVGSGKAFQKAFADYNSAMATIKGLKAKLQMIGINIQSLEKGNISPTINIISPIDGFVRFVEVNIGAFVEPNMDMFEIVDNRHVHVDLLVYEKDIHKIKKGQEIHFTVSSIPDRKLKGTIFSVGQAFENEVKAITVHADIENKEGVLIPGMYVNGHIITDNLTTDTLPEEAVVAEGEKFFIFVKTEPEEHTLKKDNEQHDKEEENEQKKLYFKKVEIIPGTRDNGFVEIKLLAPLPENAGVAVNAAYYLLAEMGKGETEHSH